MDAAWLVGRGIAQRRCILAWSPDTVPLRAWDAHPFC